jgi:hypothetical protein
MFRIPRTLWRRRVRAEAARARDRLGFMGADHHAVRDFVVLELARRDTPLDSSAIAAGTGLGSERTVEVLDDLERNLTYLFRRDGRRVDWAYPVTVERTPHRIRLDSGERLFGA